MTTAISNLSATWSNSSIAYNAISMNVTNTGANNQSTLLNYSVNGNVVTRISSTGKLRLGSQTTNYNVADPSVTGGMYAERPINIIDENAVIKITRIDGDAGVDLQRYNASTNNIVSYMDISLRDNNTAIRDRTTGTAYILMNVSNSLIQFNRDTNISGNLTANVINASNIFLSGTDIASALNPTPNIQTFLANGTWYKPAGTWSKVLVKIWGGGGAGANSNPSGSSARDGNAGGGGAGFEKEFFYYELGSTANVIVGIGGQTSTANGTLSSFSSNGLSITAYGGGGGSSSTFRGGGGGGLGGTGGQPAAGKGGGGAGGNDTNSTLSGVAPGSDADDGIVYGGGGGGAAPNSDSTSTTTMGLGGGSIYGGGGGGSGNVQSTIAMTIRLGGSSVFGGAGGNGSTSTINAQPGFFPAGGGGGGGGTASRNIFGKGANGYCVVITY